MIVLLLGHALAADQALLLVGNSYVMANNLEQATMGVFAAGHPDDVTRAERQATPGYTLPQHLADADGSNGDTPLRDALVTGEKTWNWVILQDQSQIPGFPEEQDEVQASLAALPGLDALVAGSGAQTVLLMTWGRRDGDEFNPDWYPDYTTMQDLLAEGYLRYAEAITTDERTAWIAPAGYAWRHVHAAAVAAGEDPLAEDSLFRRLYQEDGSHPSPLGTWMTACVVYSTVTGDRCAGLDAPDDLDPADVAAIQAAADAAVFEESGELVYPWGGGGGDDTGDTGDTGADTGDTGAGCTELPLTQLDEWDATGDGDFEGGVFREYTYDANWQVLTNVLDSDRDGDADNRTDYTRTATGLPVTEARDADADTLAEWFGTYTHRDDDTLERLVVDLDDDDDGTPDRRAEFLYDDNGYRSREEYDNDLDGVADSITTYTYDDDGLWLDYTQDFEADGVIDVHYSFTYDDDGNMTWALGSYGSTSVYTYDGNGCLLEHRHDSFGDGSIDIVWAYVCDSAGRHTLEEMDYGYDGTINQRVANTYDAAGNLIQRDYEDRQPDAVTGTPNFRDTWTYNAAGDVLSDERDDNADGSVDAWTTYTYDESGYLVGMETGGPSVGTGAYVYTMVNDAHGYLISYDMVVGTGEVYRGAYTYTECR